MARAAKPKTNFGNDRKKNIELAMTAINRQFGPNAIMRLGESPRLDVASISTGSIAIDLCLGIGGLPRG